MSRRILTLLALTAAIALGGCRRQTSDSKGDPDAGTDTDTDTDVDSDTDSDSDSDTDGDTDTDTGPDDTTNLGTEFWSVGMDNYVVNQPIAIAVFNPYETVAHVVLEKRTGMDWVVLEETDVTADATYAFTLTSMVFLDTFHVANRAVRVTSDSPVAAYQFNPAEGLNAIDEATASNDGTQLIAKNSLGLNHYVLAYPPNVDGAQALVICTEDGTTVSVTPSSAIISGLNVPAIPAGETEFFQMDASDVLQLKSFGDVTGSYIESDKPVAVFGGNDCVYVPSTTSYCDHLEHQLFPIDTWGENFVAARSPIRSLYQEPENDYWRVIAAEDETWLETEPPVPGLDDTWLDAGEVAEVGANHSFTISATAPIMVGQFLTGGNIVDVPFEGPNGDPAFALVVPTEQYLREHHLYVPPKYIDNYAVITHPAGVYPALDGEPVTSNPDCESEALSDAWEITRCLINTSPHYVTSSEPIAATVWGYGSTVSYGYTAGFGLAGINSDD